MQTTTRMVNFKEAGLCFNLRSAALLTRDDEVLLFYFQKADIWTLPGGRCNVLETSEAAVIRECQEELDITVKANRLLWVAENYFAMYGENTHEILFVYLVDVVSGAEKIADNEFYAHEGDKKMLCKWVKISNLDKYNNFVPAFLVEKLKHIPEQIEHLVQGK